MTLNTPFLDAVEGILLLGRHPSMTVYTFDHIRLIAWSLLNANAPFSLNQSFDRDMAVLAFDPLDLFAVMAIFAILIKGLPVVVTG